MLTVKCLVKIMAQVKTLKENFAAILDAVNSHCAICEHSFKDESDKISVIIGKYPALKPNPKCESEIDSDGKECKSCREIEDVHYSKNVHEILSFIFEYPFRQNDPCINEKLKCWWWKQEPCFLCNECTEVFSKLYEIFWEYQKLVGKTSQLSKVMLGWANVTTEVLREANVSTKSDARKLENGKRGGDLETAAEIRNKKDNNGDRSEDVNHVIENVSEKVTIGSSDLDITSRSNPVRRCSTRIKKPFTVIISSTDVRKKTQEKSAKTLVKSEARSSSRQNVNPKLRLNRFLKKKQTNQKPEIPKWSGDRTIKEADMATHKCEYCSKQYTSLPSLNDHIAKYHFDQTSVGNIPQSRCTECNHAFSSITALAQHVASEHDEPNAFVFQQSELSLSDSERLKSHFEDAHASCESIIRCMDCGKSFVSMHHLSLHCKNVHEVNVNFEDGKQIFSDLTDLKLEKRSNDVDTAQQELKTVFPLNADKTDSSIVNSTNGDETFKCVQCNEVFKNKRQLREHALFHEDNQPRFGCTQCPKKFFRPILLKKHMLTHAEKKKFACEDCHKIFMRSDHLKRHKEIHTRKGTQEPHLQRKKPKKEKKDKVYSCSECEKTFDRKEYLQLHLRIHTGEKPFHCPTCEKTFRDPRNLSQHLTTHQNDRPFCCSVCGMTFKRAHHLRDHEKLHAENVARPFICTIPDCGKAFKLKKHLVVHEQSHANSKDQVCFVCGKAFNRKDNLRQHINNVHGKDFAAGLLHMVQKQQTALPASSVEMKAKSSEEKV